MSSKPLLIEKKEKIASIILNRPKVMNAMSKEMILGLGDAVREIASDDGIQVLVLKGAGDHFCSGADLNLFTENIPSHEWISAMKGVGQIVRTMREMPQPVVTMLKGVAAGGGANLALAGDFVIAADNARFCEIFVNIGTIMDYGGHYYLPRLVGLTKAREATLAQKPPLALRLIKEGLEKSFDLSLKEVLDWEAAHQSIALQTPDHKEIVKLFLEAKNKKG
jgi:enoyl-CoA hydratase/carnithine racemase